MTDAAQAEIDARRNIAAAVSQTPEQVTPTTHETPFNLVVNKATEKTAEGADVVANTAEEVGSFAFGGSTTEVRPSNDWRSMLRQKLSRKLKPGEELVEKEVK